MPINMNTEFTIAQKDLFISEKNELIQSLDILKTDHSHVKTLIQSRIEEINNWLNEFQKNMSDYYNLMNYLFNSEVSQIKTTQQKFYKPKIALTYAPPQVGKTQAIINIIKDCIAKGISIVISSDNKKDQMSQLFSRLVKNIEINYSIFENCFITTVDNKNFEQFNNEMKKNSEKGTFIICCLDNKTQIQKVYEKINCINLDKLCLIHDEADVITKARNISEIVSGQPESHKKWIEFVNNSIEKGIDIKRVFVTATPENVVYLHRPGYVWELPTPKNYVSGEQIHFNELNDFDTKTITRILTREVKDREEEGGIILYCVERNKDENEDYEGVSNQNSVFSSLIGNIKKIGLDAISVYNSNGFKFVFRSTKHKKIFINKLEELNINYNTNENDTDILVIKKTDLAICKFYGLLQIVGCKTVLTIGKDLISRGISFVSDQIDNPLTATTMIYKPGTQLSQVSLTQAIGRLNGTAQPSLIRRLYTTDDVYSNYKTFITNQKEIMSAIRNNNHSVDEELISDIALWKASRPVDRKALKLEKDMTFWSDSDSGCETDESDETRMKNLVDNWWNADTIIGRIFNFVYQSNSGVSETELKNYITSLGGIPRTWYTDLHTPNKDYWLVFTRDSGRITKIRDIAKQYVLSKS